MSLTILVVDDDPTTRLLLHTRLKAKGYEVHVADDGDIGLELAQEIKPNLIILDVDMPRMDGYTFISMKNKIQEIKAIPVLILTAYSETQPIFQMQGASDYFVKPLDFNAMLERIEMLIGSP